MRMNDVDRINESLLAATGQARVPAGSGKGGQFASTKGGMRRSSTPGVVGTQRTRVAPAPRVAPAAPAAQGQWTRRVAPATPGTTKSGGRTLTEQAAIDKAAGKHYSQQPGYVAPQGKATYMRDGATPHVPATPATPHAPAASTPTSGPTLTGPVTRPQVSQVRATLKASGLQVSDRSSMRFATRTASVDSEGYKVSPASRLGTGTGGTLHVEHVGGMRSAPLSTTDLTARNAKARASLEAKGFETKDGRGQQYFLVTGKRTVAKPPQAPLGPQHRPGVPGANGAPRSGSSGNMTRKDAITALRSGGYRGPVNMSVPNLNKLHKERSDPSRPPDVHVRRLPGTRRQPRPHGY